MTGSQPAARAGWAALRRFSVVGGGELVSGLGSALSGFALGVWIYQRTQSVTLLSAVELCFIVPSLVVAPLAGAWVDRCNRRRVMLASNGGLAVIVSLLALAACADWLSLPVLCAATALMSILRTFQALSFAAATSQLVPPSEYARAGGLVEAGQAIAELVGPLAAGFLMVASGLGVVLALDFASFLVAIATAAVVALPDPPRPPDKPEGTSVVREMREGFGFLRERRGLFGMLLLFATSNFCVGMATVLLTPLVLAKHSAAALGVVLAVAGAGTLAGSLLLGIWGGPKRKMGLILAVGLTDGLLLAIAGAHSSLVVLAICVMGIAAASPLVNGLSHAIWQVKIPLEMQGRAFSIQHTVAAGALPLAYALAGPLADRVFEPALMPGGALAGSVGAIVGVGAGRGVGVLFVLLGGLSVVAALAAIASRRIRAVEVELPDLVTPEQTAEQEPA